MLIPEISPAGWPELRREARYDKMRNLLLECVSPLLCYCNSTARHKPCPISPRSLGPSRHHHRHEPLPRHVPRSAKKKMLASASHALSLLQRQPRVMQLPDVPQRAHVLVPPRAPELLPRVGAPGADPPVLGEHRLAQLPRTLHARQLNVLPQRGRRQLVLAGREREREQAVAGHTDDLNFRLRRQPFARRHTSHGEL